MLPVMPTAQLVWLGDIDQRDRLRSGSNSIGVDTLDVAPSSVILRVQ
jgi:hypothetical protein